MEQKQTNTSSQEYYSYISSEEISANKEQGTTGHLNTKTESSTSIDLECLSPAPISSSSSSSTSSKVVCHSHSHIEGSFIDHRNEKGVNFSKKLNVNVSHSFQEKKNNSLSEDLVNASASTSAASPQETEGGVHSKNEILEVCRAKQVEEMKINDKENNNISSPNSDQVSGEQNSEVANENNAALEPQVANNNETQNSDDSNVTIAGQELNNNFIDSLEFILDKTPIMSIFMSMICLALISGIGVSMMEGKYSHRYLFVIVYIFLLYGVIEKILKMMRDIAPQSPVFSLMIRKESFYDVVDIISVLFVTINADLRLSGVVGSSQYSLYYILGVFCVYCFYSGPPLKKKALGILKRLFFVVQVYAIVYKAENELDLPWKAILCSSWILLGVGLIRLCETMKKIITAFSGFSILGMISRSSKAIGIIALWLIIADLAVLMMVMIGLCKKLDLEDDGEFLKSWLTICQYLNAFLLVYSTLTGMDLLEFVLIVTEHFYGADVSIKKPEPVKLVSEIKDTYMMRMSLTYYKLIENYEGNQVESPLSPTEHSSLLKKEAHEESLCYICCSNEANGVIINCGHGGVCYDCLFDYINRKDECMECRTKVESLLKLDSEVEHGKVFMGKNVCKVLRSN